MMPKAVLKKKNNKKQKQKQTIIPEIEFLLTDPIALGFTSHCDNADSLDF